MSSTNFALLGMAMQNATAKSWQQLYSQYVFGKAGMNAISLPLSTSLDVPGPHPAGYVSGLKGDGTPNCAVVREVTLQSTSMGWTASGVVSTVDDLKTFAQSLVTEALVSDASAQAQTKGITLSADWKKYGLGVQQLGPLWGSVGSTPGAAFAMSLAQRLASIVSKVPAKEKGAKVVATLPWSEDQMVADMAARGVCAVKAAK